MKAPDFGGFQGVEKVDTLPERAKKDKSKATGKTGFIGSQPFGLLFADTWRQTGTVGGVHNVRRLNGSA
jgi:hypothetical protein